MALLVAGSNPAYYPMIFFNILSFKNSSTKLILSSSNFYVFFLDKFFSQSYNFWNEGFLIDFLQKLFFFNILRKFVSKSFFFINDKFFFDKIVFFFIDSFFTKLKFFNFKTDNNIINFFRVFLFFFIFSIFLTI